MLQKVQIFLFILSALYWIIFLTKLVIISREDNPEPMTISTVEKVLMYLSASYIITGIITLFIK